ncbi:MAG: NfeD family protein [Mariprofundales bacterium]|nr:NfeD family protein [Mariprofundales bacterium]
MLELIGRYLVEFWLVTGVSLLIVELLMFSLSFGLLLFAGVGGLLTALLLFMEVIPATPLVSIVTFATITALAAVLLWRPLKRMQSMVDTEPISDWIGLRFRLEQAITRTQPGSISYSGVVWRVEIAAESGLEAIPAGVEVEVLSLDAGVFRVATVDV